MLHIVSDNPSPIASEPLTREQALERTLRGYRYAVQAIQTARKIGDPEKELAGWLMIDSVRGAADNLLDTPPEAA